MTAICRPQAEAGATERRARHARGKGKASRQLIAVHQLFCHVDRLTLLAGEMRPFRKNILRSPIWRRQEKLSRMNIFYSVTLKTPLIEKV